MQIQTPAKNDFANAEENETARFGRPMAGLDLAPLFISEKQFRRRYGVGKTTAYRLLNVRDPQNAAIRSLKLGTRRLIEVRSADAHFARLLESQIEGGR